MGLVLVLGVRNALGEQERITDPAASGVHVELDLGAAGGGDDTTPVRIATVDRGLDQRTRRDRTADADRGVDVGGSLDTDGDQARRPLTVAGHASCESLGQPVEGRFEVGRRQAGLVPAPEHHGVVGRGVAIDRHALEAPRVDASQEVDRRVADRGVRQQEPEHRRHVRVDHPGALPDPDRTRAVGEPVRDDLRDHVGGHDRLCEGLGALDGVGARQGGQGIEDAFDREPLADDSGGEEQHLFRSTADELGQGRADASVVIDALASGRAVGVARVDQQRTDTPAGLGEVFATDLDVCALEEAPRVDRGGRARLVRDDQPEI